MKPNFISSTHSLEKLAMYCKSNSSVVIIGNSIVEIKQECFDSFLHKYKILKNPWGLATSFLIIFQECFKCAKRQPSIVVDRKEILLDGSKIKKQQ